jgi:hypothetical protein
MANYECLTTYEKEAVGAALDKLQLRLRGSSDSVCLLLGEARGEAMEALATLIVKSKADAIRNSG